MLAKRITLPSIHLTELTPFTTHCSRLFVAAKKVNSFRINQIQTLAAKHPGAVSRLNLRNARTGYLPKFTVLPCAPYRFLCSLFSWPYKTLFAQPLSFHIYTKPPGWRSRRADFPTQVDGGTHSLNPK